jgi:hypothetical protein
MKGIIGYVSYCVVGQLLQTGGTVALNDHVIPVWLITAEYSLDRIAMFL